MKKDMHIHTTWSDGDKSEKEICKLIKENNIKRFAITDHDTLNGDKALFANKELMEDLKANEISVVSGIEVSSINDGIKMHILGYGFDLNAKEINEVAEELTRARQLKKEKLLSHLKDNFGIVLKEEKIKELDKNNTVGKPHIAKILIKEGYAESVKDAIVRYFKDFKHKDSKIPAERTIKNIHASGGIAVLAHPKEIMNDYNLKYKDIKKILKKLVGYGLDGIEINHSLHTLKDSKKFKYFAKHFHLVCSEGSDYHGESVKPNVHIGVCKYQPY